LEVDEDKIVLVLQARKVGILELGMKFHGCQQVEYDEYI
jgi:hypothetical protein